MRRTIRYGTFETNSSSMHSICIMKNEGEYSPDEMRAGLWLDKEGRIDMYESDLTFGRHPFRILCTFADKLAFAIASLCADKKPESAYQSLEMIKGIVKELIPDFTDFHFETREIEMFIDEDGNEVTKEDMEYIGEGLYRYEIDGATYDNVSFPHWQTPRSVEIYGDQPVILKGFHYQKDGKICFARLDEENFLEMPLFGGIDHQSFGLLDSLLKRGVSLKDFLSRKEYIVVIDGDEYCDFEKYIASGVIDKNIIREQIR